MAVPQIQERVAWTPKFGLLVKNQGVEQPLSANEWALEEADQTWEVPQILKRVTRIPKTALVPKIDYQD